MTLPTNKPLNPPVGVYQNDVGYYMSNIGPSEDVEQEPCEISYYNSKPKDKYKKVYIKPHIKAEPSKLLNSILERRT